MNYSNVISQCIEFIEENIKGDLTPELIANKCGYSTFHFCRIFNIHQGITLMEYVKKRRISLAAAKLFEGNRIIDIAIEYGFDTHNGFSKAFKKEYGFTPTQYIKRMDGYFSKESIYKIGGYIMDPIIVKRPAFKVAGYGIKTNISNGNYTKDVASFWSNYNGENLESKMYKILEPPKHGEVGLCIPSKKGDGETIYLLGVIVDDFQRVTDDMMTIDIPEATYAVFTTPPVDTSNDTKQKEFAKIIKETWKYIFKEWFKETKYIFDESKMDFEFYDERCHGRKDTVMEIYIPIIEK
ncbi:AraC family transcriptional regulator [Terrisporobacter petrolearius]|uniref:AraC family transcriptional regulator n=1 Tax=Terrisporobacter petrolearius TaxID=1460447 RepID=UPI001D16497D|nr:AraC family transcriptional regulator [Terrisporobacter petrolearius]MCC3865226.1 AraC family transcriptional regulator [Terrisporobacter petrolearius]